MLAYTPQKSRFMNQMPIWMGQAPARNLNGNFRLSQPANNEFSFGNIPNALPWFGGAVATYVASDFILPGPWALIGKGLGVGLGLWGVGVLFKSSEQQKPVVAKGFETVPRDQDLSSIRGKILSPVANEVVNVPSIGIFSIFKSNDFFTVKTQLTNTSQGTLTVPLIISFYQPKQKNSVGIAKRAVPLVAGETKAYDIMISLNDLAREYLNDVPTTIQLGYTMDVQGLTRNIMLDQVTGISTHEA